MIIDYLPKNGGVDTSDATATTADILSGKSAYVNDIKLNGELVKYNTTINGVLQNRNINANMYNDITISPNDIYDGMPLDTYLKNVRSLTLYQLQ